MNVISINNDNKKQAKRLLQINVTANWGSHGRIAEGIGEAAMAAGWESYIAYGRYMQPSQSHLIKIGTRWDQACHLFQTRLFDRHGLASQRATYSFVNKIEQIKPDIVHLHNIHGYYLNYPILFNYLQKNNIQVIWTLHDCWAFTGHCAYFSVEGCEKWKEQCHNCSLSKSYPKATFFDRSRMNFLYKKSSFTSIKKVILVPVSDWIKGLVSFSFLNQYPMHRIWNGIDIEQFRPCDRKEAISKYGTYILGVASKWEKRKGLDDFLALRQCLPEYISIVLVGLKKEQSRLLTKGIISIERTENIEQMQKLYSGALAFINPTWEDNFPTTNLEALACGTPVVTYNTGGSVEAINPATGIIVEQGDIIGLAKAINKIEAIGRNNYTEVCRARAVSNFNKVDRFHEYISLYDKL